MACIAGGDRTQAVLLPDVLDDFARPDNPVRFLHAFVAQLDLAALGFQQAVPAETGRPGYAPGDLLRLYLYGYLHQSYAPELNPGEYLNGDLKLAVVRRAPARDRATLLRSATSRLRSLQRRPERVKKLFHHPRVRYAAECQLNRGPSNRWHQRRTAAVSVAAHSETGAGSARAVVDIQHSPYKEQ